MRTGEKSVSYSVFYFLKLLHSYIKLTKTVQLSFRADHVTKELWLLERQVECEVLIR